MAEYIKREDMNNTLDEMCVVDGIYNALQAIPAADVVEVVRCKDCIFCKYNEDADVHKCDRRGYFTEYINPDEDYCSKGERRSNNV